MRVHSELGMTVNMATASTSTQVYDSSHLYLIGVHYFCGTSTAAGKLELYASVDGVTFFPHTTVNVSLAGAALNDAIKVADFQFPYFKVVYTKTSGSGTLNVYVAAKGF